MERKLAIAMILSELQITGGWKDLGYGNYLGYRNETWVVSDEHGHALAISEEKATKLVEEFIDSI